MPNALLESWRKDLAALGVKDDRPDWMVMRDDLVPLAHQNPELLKQYPDFAREFGDLRDAEAPSLAGEAGRALESGTQGLFSDLDSAAALGLHGAGLDKASDYYMGRAKDLEGAAAENAPTVPTVEDIAPGRTGADRVFSKDTARYVAAKAGGAIPSLLEIIGLSAAGAAVGSAAEPGVGTVVGAGEGALEGALGRGVIRSAMRSLAKKAEAGAVGAIEHGSSEEAIADAIRAGDKAVAGLVDDEAKSIAATRGGEVAGVGLGAYPLSAGGIYKDTGRADLAAGLGAVGALAGAAPVVGLPARVARAMFPRLSQAAAQDAAAKIVGQKASELLDKLGRAGVATAAGTAGVVGMEATNIVAKNITLGKDALDLDASDWRRLREAAVGGAIASVPFAGLATRGDTEVPAPRERGGEPPPVPPTPGMEAPPAPPPPAAPVGRSPGQVYRDVNRMTPDEQRARIAELGVNPARKPDEESEYQLLRALVPAPEGPAAVAAGPAEVVAPQSGAPPTQQASEPQSDVAPPPAAPAAAPDRVRYDEIQREISDLTRQGTKADDPEIQRLWAENEAIKNRNGGMPPGETSGAEGAPPAEAVPASNPLPTPLPDAIPVGTTPAPGAPVTPVEPAGIAPAAETIQPPEATPAPEQFSRAQITAQRTLIADLQQKISTAQKTGNSGNRRRISAWQRQLDVAQARLPEMMASKRTGRALSVGMGPEGAPDLLSVIEDVVGKLQSENPNHEFAGESNGFRETLSRGAARLLNGGKLGFNPADALPILEREGYKFGSPDELRAGIEAAVEARIKYGEGFKRQAYQRSVESAALENAGRKPGLKPTGGAKIEDVGVGGAFDIRGEKFSVVDVEERPDGTWAYIVQDGHRFEVPEGSVVYPDKGSLRTSGKQGTSDFLPPEKPSAETLARGSFEELRGKTVRLPAFDAEGRKVEVELDAAEAWADTQKRRNIYQALLRCLRGET